MKNLLSEVLLEALGFGGQVDFLLVGFMSVDFLTITLFTFIGGFLDFVGFVGFEECGGGAGRDGGAD